MQQTISKCSKRTNDRRPSEEVDESAAMVLEGVHCCERRFAQARRKKKEGKKSEQMTKQSSQSQNCFSFPVADGLCERCAHHGVVPHRRCRQRRSVSFFTLLL